MKTPIQAELLRRKLDKELKNWRQVTPKPPKRGWIRETREALDMSAAQLARRMKVSQAAITTLERSEANGTIQLKTLRRVAKAFGANLIYAVVPEVHSLEKRLQQQRRMLAERDLAPFVRTKKGTPPGLNELFEEYGKHIKPKHLWKDAQIANQGDIAKIEYLLKCLTRKK